MDLTEYLANDYLAADVRVLVDDDHRSAAAMLVARLLAADASGPKAREAEVRTIARALLEPIGAHCVVGREGDESASRIAALIEALLESPQ
jgi:hypothetical protein